MRQQLLLTAGITPTEQADMLERVWSGIKDGMKAEDVHVSVVGNRVEKTRVPNHTARAKARDQALDIVGTRAPRVNSAVVTRISVRITRPSWAKPAESNEIIDVTPANRCIES